MFQRRGQTSYNRGRGGGRGDAFANTKPKGLFADGSWYCNCPSRLPAEHFKVKKEGKNQGRWFYTCQNKEPQRCDFFLWDEDAKPREEAAVLGNSRNEPRATPGVFAEREGHASAGAGGISGGDWLQTQRRSQSRTVSPTPPPLYQSQDTRLRVPEQSNSGFAKRKMQDTDFDDDDDDVFPWPLTGQEEEELAQAAEHVAVSPSTPRKATKTDAYATPATTGARKLPWLDYSAETAEATTPTITSRVSPPQSNMLPTPGTNKTLGSLQTTSADATTPTPSRFKDALADPSALACPLVDEVFALFASSNTVVPGSTASELRGLLTRYDLRTQGVAKGREISRLALKAKDAKLAELQARIASLEAEREVDRSLIRKLRFERGTDGGVVSP